MSDDPGDEPMTLARLLKIAKGPLTLKQFAAKMPVKPETNTTTPGEKALEGMLAGDMSAFPSPDTIRRLAIGCGVTEQAILDACATTLGIKVTRNQSMLQAVLPGGLDVLTDDETSIIRSMLITWVKLHRQAKDD